MVVMAERSLNNVGKVINDILAGKEISRAKWLYLVKSVDLTPFFLVSLVLPG